MDTSPLAQLQEANHSLVAIRWVLENNLARVGLIVAEYGGQNVRLDVDTN